VLKLKKWPDHVEIWNFFFENHRFWAPWDPYTINSFPQKNEQIDQSTDTLYLHLIFNKILFFSRPKKGSLIFPDYA